MENPTIEGASYTSDELIRLNLEENQKKINNFIRYRITVNDDNVPFLFDIGYKSYQRIFHDIDVDVLKMKRSLGATLFLLSDGKLWFVKSLTTNPANEPLVLPVNFDGRIEDFTRTTNPVDNKPDTFFVSSEKQLWSYSRDSNSLNKIADDVIGVESCHHGIVVKTHDQSLLYRGRSDREADITHDDDLEDDNDPGPEDYVINDEEEDDHQFFPLGIEVASVLSYGAITILISQQGKSYILVAETTPYELHSFLVNPRNSPEIFNRDENEIKVADSLNLYRTPDLDGITSVLILYTGYPLSIVGLYVFPGRPLLYSFGGRYKDDEFHHGVTEITNIVEISDFGMITNQGVFCLYRPVNHPDDNFSWQHLIPKPVDILYFDNKIPMHLKPRK